MKRLHIDDGNDVALHERAEREAAQDAGAPDSAVWAQGIVAQYRGKIAEARPRLLPQIGPLGRATPPGPDLAMLSREALLTRIAALTSSSATPAGLRYRDLSDQTDDDLRQIVATLERATPRTP